MVELLYNRLLPSIFYNRSNINSFFFSGKNNYDINFSTPIISVTMFILQSHLLYSL